jgi:hypothetical protein
MESPELELKNQAARIYGRWWVLALAVILGGLLGWGVHILRPPLYESKTRMVVTFDFSQTGNLSPYNLDQAVGAIQAIFLSGNLLNEVIEQAGHSELNLQLSDFSKMIRMERMNESWFLRVRDTDQDRAAVLVDVWAKKGYRELSEAHFQALKAEILKKYVRALEYCPAMPGIQNAIPAICFRIYAYGLEDEALLEELQQALKLSRGINPSLMISPPEMVPSTEEPVMYLRNWMILAGMVAGALIGTFFLLGFPYRPKY